jgi:ribosomal protein S18 acetylase RimI-like enzyme
LLDFLRLSDKRLIDEHAPSMAAWIFDSGPGFFSALFGERTAAEETLRKWLHRPTSDFSASHATLGLDDGAVVGMFIGNRGADIPACRRADLLALLQQSSAEQRIELKQILEEIAELTAPINADEFYIRTIAVDPAHRGCGFGRKLTQRAIEHAHLAGFARCRLDVDCDNEVALGLYRSLGFETIYEGAAPKFGLRMYSMLHSA